MIKVPDTFNSEVGRKAVEVVSTFEEVIAGGPLPARAAEAGRLAGRQGKLFEKPEEQEVAKATYRVIKQYERLKGSDQLQDAAIQREIVEKVQEIAKAGRPKACWRASLKP